MRRAVPLALFLAVFLVILIRTAWVCDDAYIGFRVVWNLVHGYGLTWNPVERVQAFTPPLWFLGLSPLVQATGDVYYTALAIQIACSLAAVAVFALRVAPSTPIALLGVLVFSLSRSFVDYSTSGLENALTHLLLAVFVALELASRKLSPERHVLVSSLLASLILLNRMDTVLLVAPLLVADVVRAGRDGLRNLALGMVPFVVWEGFSIFYYGSLLPNPAFAKLDTGIGTGELLTQGFAYLSHAVRTDPLTVAVLLGGIVSSALTESRPIRQLGLGICLYVVYVLKIGGDFMAGRFLAAPFFCSVCVLAHSLPDRRAILVPAGIAVAALGLLAPRPTVTSGPGYGAERGPWIEEDGITDERAFHYPSTGLLRRNGVPVESHGGAAEGLRAAREGVRFVESWNVGLRGYYGGPSVHVLDLSGIADPLLARLPARRDRVWGPGHFERAIPEGYRETLASGRNVLLDPNLRFYYDRLSEVLRGPLFRVERLISIWDLLRGRYETLLERERYRYPAPQERRLNLAQVSTVRPEGSLPTRPGTFPMSRLGLRVSLGGVRFARRLQLSLENSDDYRLVFVRDARSVATARVTAAPLSNGGLRVYEVRVPGAAVDAGYDRILVFPEHADGSHVLGHLWLIE